MLCPVHPCAVPEAAWAGALRGVAQKGVTWSGEGRGNGCVPNASLFVEQRHHCVRETGCEMQRYPHFIFYSDAKQFYSSIAKCRNGIF